MNEHQKHGKGIFLFTAYSITYYTMKKIFLLLLLCFLFSCNKNSEISKSIWDEKTVIPSKIILALWDSLTAWLWVEENQNYPSKLQKLLDDSNYNYTVINAWMSGDTSENLKSRISLYIDKKPKIVLLVIWWNDGLRWLSPIDLKKNIWEIIELYERIWSKIVLWTMDLPENMGAQYRTEFKKVYQEILQERKNIYDLGFFLEWVGWIRELNQNDGIHPNSQGYDIISKNVFLFLEEKKLIQK